MFKFVTFFACITFALAAPSLLAEHHTIVEEPVLTKVGSVVHSAPSAVSHQSFTRVHNKAVVSPVVAPVVKTTLHSAPVVTPVVKTVEHVGHVAPLVHSVHAAPVISAVEHVVPVVKTVHTPVVHTVAAAPVVGHAVSHQSHVQIHSNAAVVSPVVHASPIVHSVPLVHSAPAVHVVHH